MRIIMVGGIILDKWHVLFVVGVVCVVLSGCVGSDGDKSLDDSLYVFPEIESVEYVGFGDGTIIYFVDGTFIEFWGDSTMGLYEILQNNTYVKLVVVR